MKIPFVAVSIAVYILYGFTLTRAGERPLPAACTYEMQVWNVNLKSSTDMNKVRHSYSELSPEEIDPATGCTVCSEDQVLVDVPPLQSFSVCHRLASRVRTVVQDLLRSGIPLNTVIGYHVIKSRGPVNGNGDRTGFSNHSFGTAIDINPEQNGLYDNCIEFGPQCRLLRGGEWRPGAPGSFNKNSDIVSMFKQAGFKWGGEIAGKQKDFMHFSLTGY